MLHTLSLCMLVSQPTNQFFCYCCVIHLAHLMNTGIHWLGLSTGNSVQVVKILGCISDQGHVASSIEFAEPPTQGNGGRGCVAGGGGGARMADEVDWVGCEVRCGVWCGEVGAGRDGVASTHPNRGSGRTEKRCKKTDISTC